MLKILCYVLCLCLSKCLIRVDACGPTKYLSPKDEMPKKFRYKERVGLNVVLTLQNVPREATSYEIYEIGEYQSHRTIIRDGSWSSENHTPEIHQTPTEENSKILLFNVVLEESNSHTTFEVSLKKNNGVLCNKNQNRKFLKIMHAPSEPSGPSNKRLNIKMNWNNECYNTPAAETDTSAQNVHPGISPVVNPANFTDSGHPFAVFTCSARCYPGEVLAWFQDQHLPGRAPTVLLVKHIHNEYLTSGTMYLQIILNKTLEDADRGTSIFCGRREISRDGDGKTVLGTPPEAKVIVTSTNIELNFTRKMKTETPKVTIKPDGVVNYKPNSTLEFVCSSTLPLVDGKTLDWYEEDLNSTSNRTLASNQYLSEATNTNTLKLYVDEAYVLKNTYCVLQHRIVNRNRYISLEYDFRYREMARSAPIKLQRENAAAAAASGDRAHKLIIAGACVVGALVLLLAGLLASRRWRRQSSAQEEEGDYVVPQITYAVLSLPETDSKPPNKPDKQNYVEIVGVYKNKMKNK